MTNIQLFEEFLKNIDLKFYREKYRPIKIVEMDLPKEIQAISLLYETYWDKQQLLPFEEFYDVYFNEKKELLEKFRIKIQMCKKCFYLGLPARIYRTWASLITQIHAGYVAESVFGKETTNMSSDLDHKGVDILVKYKGHILNYQVKKKSESREIRIPKKTKLSIEGEFLDLFYEVPSDDIFANPKKKNGDYKLQYSRFINAPLKRLDNGFVVFTEEAFNTKKEEIDK